MNKINSYVKSLGENNQIDLCVIVGETINNNGKKYYYVALSTTGESAESLGFYIEYKEYDENYNIDLKDFIVSIDELEQLTGMDFFCEWPDNYENYLEEFKKEELYMFFNN